MIWLAFSVTPLADIVIPLSVHPLRKNWVPSWKECLWLTTLSCDLLHGWPQLLSHDHVLPQAAPSQWLSEGEFLLFPGLPTVWDWAKCWYKNLGISVQWNTSLVNSFYSGASHRLSGTRSGLRSGPIALLDQSHLFSFPFTNDTPQQTFFTLNCLSKAWGWSSNNVTGFWFLSFHLMAPKSSKVLMSCIESMWEQDAAFLHVFCCLSLAEKSTSSWNLIRSLIVWIHFHP